MRFQRRTTQLVAPTVAYFAGGAPGDLIGLADVREELSITSKADDAWLKKVIRRMSARIARFCNRDFGLALWRDEIWPGSGNDPWILPSSTTELQLSQMQQAVIPSTAGIAPPQAPVLSTVSGGASAAAIFFVRISYVTATGETPASLEMLQLVPAGSLLAIASPPLEPDNQAIGWKAYVGLSSWGETLQTPTPIAIGTAWTLPASGLINGLPVAPHILIVEDAAARPTPLCEGRDYLLKPDVGSVLRLSSWAGRPGIWHKPVTAIYRSPFLTVPDDLQDATLQLVKARWFARDLDPMIRSQSAGGVYEEQRWLGTGIGGEGDLPADVAATADRYRQITLA